jgi:mRNA-degrading endonuclease toxin of MazEF toxin-antitoxin module
VALHSHGGSLPTLGSISYLAREKATITVDREKRSEARAMLGAASASAAIDIARSQLIWRHRLRNDPTACLRTPPAAEKAALALIPPEWGDLADDAGVRRASAVNLDNLPLVSRARLARRVTRVSPHTLRAIGAAGPEAIGCPASRAKLG